jgi:transposase
MPSHGRIPKAQLRPKDAPCAGPPASGDAQGLASEARTSREQVAGRSRRGSPPGQAGGHAIDPEAIPSQAGSPPAAPAIAAPESPSQAVHSSWTPSTDIVLELGTVLPPSAIDRAMLIKAVLSQVINGECPRRRASEILGITPRTLRRLRRRMEEYGDQGLVDMRRVRPSPRRTTLAEVERILGLYREHYPGLSASRFAKVVREEYCVTLSYGSIRRILQEAGLVMKGQTGTGAFPADSSSAKIERTLHLSATLAARKC